ncbi:hypothetical protein PR202_ga10034 [Eleusine coracana subsp. coracana]|uniref:Uncharacterized protein n=1 Tax=Eleusine coracana subsp. coracana TaxID=191504 RepID=A0AAV5C5M6_ELECO|nr:hypothetical protein PR202_ga10034 [Eleusine coracana subsp. coracana]
MGACNSCEATAVAPAAPGCYASSSAEARVVLADGALRRFPGGTRASQAGKAASGGRVVPVLRGRAGARRRGGGGGRRRGAAARAALLRALRGHAPATSTGRGDGGAPRARQRGPRRRRRGAARVRRQPCPPPAEEAPRGPGRGTGDPGGAAAAGGISCRTSAPLPSNRLLSSWSS